MEEVLLDREILNMIDDPELDWDDPMSELDSAWPVEELPHDLLQDF